MEVLDQGVNPIFTDPDPDKAREFFRQKSRAMVDKRMTEKEAVEKFVHDGDYFAAGGFGANRIPNSILHEIVRQRKKNLGFLGHTSTHDFQVLAAGKVLQPLRLRLHRGPRGPRSLAERPQVHPVGRSATDRMEQLRARRPPESGGRRRLLRHHPQPPGHRHLQDVGGQGHRVPVHRQEVRGRSGLLARCGGHPRARGRHLRQLGHQRHLGGRPRAGPGRQAPDHHHREDRPQLGHPRRPDPHVHPVLHGRRGGRSALRQLSRATWPTATSPTRCTSPSG